MIGRAIDGLVGLFSPKAALQRMQARKLLRRYAGAEPSRIAPNKPKNQSANTEAAGPFGADDIRAWSRKLVRDNAYAWGAVDAIVSNVVENGIRAQSTLEDEDGGDVEDTNWARDAAWEEWCETCDYNGELSFSEIQQLALREMVEAGEVLIHLVKVKQTERGIRRKVPLALELIEADRLALDCDTYKLPGTSGNRIVRGVEIDDKGKPLAYWVYPQHPHDINTSVRQEPVRKAASEILHLFRKDRVGQTRGVGWFAPVVSWMRDLGVYVENELQASAVAACFGAVIKSDGGFTALNGSENDDTVDENGNTFEYLEPGLVARLKTNEDIKIIDPSRPNANADPWITLMLRAIAVGTGLSYELVARDYSKTSYASSRTSQLEDRRRFRCWQRYLVNHLCQPVWDEFCNAAAVGGVKGFPSASELLADRRKVAPVEWQTHEWEWVDPSVEQRASEDSINAFQSNWAIELGKRGINWKSNAYALKKQFSLYKRLGIMPLAFKELDSQLSVAEAHGNNAKATGEMSETSRLQYMRNQKAVDDILASYESGQYSRARAEVSLAGIGLQESNIEKLLDDVESSSQGMHEEQVA